MSNPELTEFLTWTAYGPLAAWGTVAVGEQRPLASRPTKSGVCGWVAAALGLTRDDHESIKCTQEDYLFACRVDAGGALLRDFHTTQRPKRSAFKKQAPTTRAKALAMKKHLETSLSQRDYRMDAIAHVALSVRHSPRFSLDTVQQALLRPAFMPYLGRKSCPLGLPPNPQIHFARTPRSALDAQARDLPALLRDRFLAQELFDKNPTYFWEGKWPGLRPQGTENRRDVAQNRQAWTFSNRGEHWSQEPSPTEAQT